MADTLEFETPENVQVRYAVAGPGTRFLAWFADQFLIVAFVLVLTIALACAGISFETAFESMDAESDPQKVGMYIIGIVTLVMGLGSFVYFTLLELLFRGQTFGKRIMGVRVVKTDGFALDAGSILIRNLFRVLDNIPLMWIVPVLSRRTQRTGDMVAGTVVISDAKPELSDARARLSERSATEAEFRFDSRTLGRLGSNDFEAVERFLDRWYGIPEKQREVLLEKLVVPLVAKMQLEAPAADRRHRFLEHLMAAEFRRQNRLLG